MCNFTVLQWCVAPLLSGTYKIYLINDTFTDRDLPYIAWFPLDTQNIFNYILLYMVEAVGMLSCIVAIYCFDSFYVSMLIITSAQLRYINRTLTKTHLLENKRASEAVCMLRKKLRNCVDCHVEIIEFLNKLQTFASPIMFIQCIETTIVVCFLSFEASAIKLTMDEENLLVLINLLLYFIAISVQLGFFCFFATQITHLTSLIPISIHSCGWEVAIFDQKEESNTNKQFKSSDIHILAQMIIVQAQKPIILTGGPFYVLSMETFRAVITLALSNSIMLRQLSDKEEG
ncbi:odorant receptor 4-like [Odontomachus brunneus]|uniref:odorant receptor 4-like n=1 Tax=Odontomachus brunneus TaxID=486640 RepID=UPI0013F23D85|nr:odorant receptor 4-like [Odontomachus brunneus]XP_032684232.1 odorant receptor 4-like [Odontomachus brunneus]